MVRFNEQIGELTHYWSAPEGKKSECKISIHRGNCLAVFNYETADREGRVKGRGWYHLWMFWDDESHLQRMQKNAGGIFGSARVKCIKLNLYYQEARTLARLITKYGYKVTCYYKEPKKKQAKK